MPIIQEIYVLSADNTDVLSAPSRLAAMPTDGTLNLQVSATDSDGSNYADLTIQLPDGSTPVDGQPIPQNGVSTADAVIKDDTALTYSFQVEQGGHVLLAVDETGTVAAICIIATLVF